MRRSSLLIRSILLCLLAFAVPVQSIAAATMLYCDPAHHSHGGDAADHSQHFAQPSDQVQSDDDLKVSLVKCSACSACASGAYMSAPAPAALPVLVSSSPPACGAPPVKGATPHGIDPPPRS